MTDPAADLFDALVERVIERVREQPPSVGYLSKAALAADLGVKERTISTWRSQGLPGVRVGKTVMYSVDDVSRWIESHRR